MSPIERKHTIAKVEIMLSKFHRSSKEADRVLEGEVRLGDVMLGLSCLVPMAFVDTNGIFFLTEGEQRRTSMPSAWVLGKDHLASQSNEFVSWLHDELSTLVRK